VTKYLPGIPDSADRERSRSGEEYGQPVQASDRGAEIHGFLLAYYCY
jgi:hypothetical protein